MWKQLIQETRTRILLIYALLLLLLTGASVPIFRYLLFTEVNERVTEDLEEEKQAFLAAYADWAEGQDSSVESIGELKAFVDDFLEDSRPEDDNFQIVLINSELYRSNPSSLLQPLRPGSELFERWQDVTAPTLNEQKVSDSAVGSVLYTAAPLLLDGEQRGVFVVAHSTAGERQEALKSVYLFVRVMCVAALVALILAWIGTGRLMAPIAALTRTATAISESDLTQRLPPSKNDSELAALTNTFNDMMDRIQAAFDSQRSFINDAGHELRTPITIIQGHLELLDDDPQERQETIELVMDELDRMGRLVSDMLLLAKSERPNFLQLEMIEMQPFMQEVFAKAKALAERNWILDTKDSAGGPIQIRGDRQKLTGALLNLLRNATQYTQPSDTIELGYRVEKPVTEKTATEEQAEGQLQLWVRDTGEGISDVDQRHIFARFSRGSRPRRSEGSGLGLAIVEAVVEAHGGRVGLISQPQKGATFQIWLPMKSPESGFVRTLAAP